jgi:hypothetical protein
MTKKIATIDLKGKNYATVPARIKEFRQDCPNGLIETKPEIREDGQILFTARILKDKANLSSGESTGHSIGSLKGDKAFEKLETIAIGRALAILGYMASGEVASSEEMEEFNEFKNEKKQEQFENFKEQVDAIKTLDELRDFYKNNKGLGAEFDTYITNRSKELKNENPQ